MERESFHFSELQPGDRLEISGEGLDIVAYVSRVLEDAVIVASVNRDEDGNTDGAGDVYHLYGTLDYHDLARPFENVFTPVAFVASQDQRLLAMRVVDSAEPATWYYDNLHVVRDDETIYGEPLEKPGQAAE